MVNGGAGYDVNNPPSVEIVDLNVVSNTDVIEIDSRWPGAPDGSALTVTSGQILKINGYSNNITISNTYSVVYDSKVQLQTLAVILSRMESLFDSTIWDFENTLEGGHPTFK